RELVEREGSLAAFVWRYEPDGKQAARPQTVSTSAESIALSKELKKRGWAFVGPTTVYAFMQAMGLVNDHVEDCVIRAKVERARNEFSRPGRRRPATAGRRAQSSAGGTAGFHTTSHRWPSGSRKYAAWPP